MSAPRLSQADMSAFLRERCRAFLDSLPDHGVELNPLTLGLVVEEMTLAVSRRGLTEASVRAYSGCALAVRRAEIAVAP